MSTETMSPQDVDESLYSRQLYVFGHDAQKRMGSSDILMVGLKGLGVETAKNVILAGVRSVGLYDPEIVKISHLGSQFYLTEQDVGKTTIAEASFSKLSTLNQYVNTHLTSGELNDELISKYKVVVMSDCTLEEQLRVNAICRQHDIKFVSGATLGLLATFFSDFGPEHIISDTDGAECLRGLISHVSQETVGVVTCNDEKRHGLSDGDYVTFEDIEGMTELNSLPPQRIRVRSPYSFTIGDTSSYHQFTGTQGYFNQVKMPVTVKFKSLSEAIKAPEFTNDLLFNSAQYHILIEELYTFHTSNGRYPSPVNAEEVTSVLNSISDRIKKADLEFEDSMRETFWKIIRGSCGSVVTVTSFAGGILGQEVLKACSGKFTPIQQFLHYAFAESSPDITETSDLTDFQSLNTRYDDYYNVYGKSIHDKLTKQSLFLVGAGAIGCEMLKNWALMGVATAENSKITVTDMDTIEKSNLNRQFLFRPADVGKLKSQSAATAVKVMNPAIRINAQSLKLSEDTESVYNDTFWRSLSGVYTALDNVETRLYVDSKCVYYRLPLVDSGTLGTKGNTQTIVPYLTESYGSTRDPPETGIPVCTLKNFPYQIEHTIQWARDFFEGTFNQAIEDGLSYIEKPNYLQTIAQQPNTQIQTLESLKSTLDTNRPYTLEQCILWARSVFDDEFYINIKQLLHHCPENHVTTEGTPFWSGTKRCPTPIIYDNNDPTHVEFIIAAASLRAFNYNIPGEVTPELVQVTLKDVPVKKFVPRDMRIATTEAEAAEMNNEGTSAPNTVENIHEIVEQLENSLPSKDSLLASHIHLQPVHFEKDDDSNHHIAFITASSNLRARIYRIKEASAHETKFVAGKIIPAIATTTALVTGLVCTEMMNLVQNKPLEAYRNTFVNLAIGLITSSEPFPPHYTIAKYADGSEYKWSLWDSIDVDLGHEPTLQEFITYAEEKFGCNLDMVNYGPVMLYVSYMPKKSENRMNIPISEGIKQVIKDDIPPHISILNLGCVLMDDEDNDVDVPEFRVKIRGF